MQHSVTLTMRELTRYEVIQQLLRKKVTGIEAARTLNLSTRQVRNLKHRVECDGPRGLIHGNRGKPSNHRTPETTKERAVGLLRRHYADFGPTFAQEKLQERHGIVLGHETVRQLMTAGGLWRPRRRRANRQYRSWRPRRERYGELVQFDGSYHEWFEDRAPACCLLAAIDDATGRIIHARFTTDEGIVPVFTFWKASIERNGSPATIYLDKFSTYKVNVKALVDDSVAQTQFERAMRELGINLIHAHSPQAKGRIERLFGTLQDRLIKEMRLRGITEIEEGNRFLIREFIEDFNARFAVQPAKRGNLHRKLTAAERRMFPNIFAIRESRTIRNDFTIQYEGRWLQLAETQSTLVCRKDKITVEQRLDGSLHLLLSNKELSYTILPARPPKVVSPKIPALTRHRTPWKPPPDHPWRRAFLAERRKSGIIDAPSK